MQTHRAAFTVSIEADVPCEIEGSGTMHKASSWLLVMRVEPATEEAEDLEIPRHRYAAVAMRLTSAALKDSLSGQVSCFSPLALQTGFPAQVSANFALTANRKDLWRKSDDTVKHGVQRAERNEGAMYFQDARRQHCMSSDLL